MPRTTKLSKLHRVVLAYADSRDDRHVLPLHASITDVERLVVRSQTCSSASRWQQSRSARAHHTGAGTQTSATAWW